MTIGEKIRTARSIKGYSQENLADILGISSVAYGDIERNKTDITYSRLEQISTALGTSIISLLNLGETVSNFFNNCTNNNVIGSGNLVFSEKELRHENEKLRLENDKLKAEKHMAEMELKYLKEKFKA